MRLIKRADMPEVELTCWRCKSIFAYNLLDIETFAYKSNDLSLGEKEFITCPVCQNINYVTGEI